jgi:hypothetical protein
MHYIVHLNTGTRPCVPGDWSCVMLKPYPAEEDKPRVEMMRRWDEAQP